MADVLSSRERDLTAVLRQRDAELKQSQDEVEDRGRLLHKTKAAIEQLQQEVGSVRNANDELQQELQRVSLQQFAEE